MANVVSLFVLILGLFGSHVAKGASVDIQAMIVERRQALEAQIEQAASQMPSAAAVIDVGAYGALGDGATDDTAALQAAIDAAPPGSLVNFGPHGRVYRISSALALRSNVIYYGRATIMLSDGAGTNMLTINGGQNIVIQGLTLDGNKQNQTKESVGIAVGNGRVNNDNIVIQGTFIKDIAGRGIRVGSPNPTTNLRIEHNRIQGTTRHGINVNRNAPGVIVQGNMISDTDPVEQAPRGQIRSNAIWIGNASVGAHVSNNYVENIGDIGIELWRIGGETTVENNIVIATKFFGISFDGAPRSVAVGNLLYNIAGSIGIEVVASNQVTVSDNVVSLIVGDPSRKGNQQQRGVAVNKSNRVMLLRNTIVNGDVGVRITHGSKATTLQESLIDSPSNFAVEVVAQGRPVGRLSLIRNTFVRVGRRVLAAPASAITELIDQENRVEGEGGN